ncbi:MAG: O-antigen ligase family protein [Verrucomicrobia bacterium]|nr:O-antigen ligase family protein [Verrucomicrobiota bacterium]
MTTTVPEFRPPPGSEAKLEPAGWSEADSAGFQPLDADPVRPTSLVRWAFYLSIFSIPFTHLYLPGTGERVGVLRLVQVLLLSAMLARPRVCLRLVPAALLWFLSYAALRIVWGLWLSPTMSASWWPSSREFLELLIPWLWLMFNVLQFPETPRGGLWALALGCALCALCHVAGIGVNVVDDGLGDRSSVFGLNANEIGITYATAAVTLLGLWMLRPQTLIGRLAIFPLIGLLGLAMAKTGSRTAVLTLSIGVLVLLLFGQALGSKARRLASLALIGAVLAVVLWQIPTVLERFEEINPHNLGYENPRARMAPVLWEMFLRSPIYGSGPDHYEFELTRRAMPYLIRQQKTIASHNLLLLLLVETGGIGLALFALGLGSALVAAWRARRRPCGPLPLALLLPLAIGGATVCNPSHHLVFWVAMAYALAGVA